MDTISVIMGGLQAVNGFLFLFFIPGFTLSLLFFPRLSDLNLIERLAYSTVLSIGLTMTIVLFMDIFLGVNLTPLNIVSFIGLFSIIVLIIWAGERIYMKRSVTLHPGRQVTVRPSPRGVRNTANRVWGVITERIRLK